MARKVFLEDLRNLLSDMKSQLKAYGYDIKLIGGVQERGYTSHDVDLDMSMRARCLLHKKADLEEKVQGLRRSQAQETVQLSSLQNKRQETRAYLELDQQTLQQRLQTSLTELKTEKPELFYITGTEQIAKLATHIIQWLLS